MTERARADEQQQRPPELVELAEDFEVEDEIGRGSTAVVYRARELALDRVVAIKVIRARHLADDEAVQRLEREARLVARLDHPNVVALHAVRRLRHGSLALVMRFVHGETLRSELRRRGPLPASRVRRLAADVARALSAAHAYGVVHRDVKPENVYVERSTGRGLLADFGAATPLERGARLTATGITIGTPGYLAPELVDGADATPQSDVYALGLVAWEALTGVQPWAGETLFEVLAFRKHGALPPLASLVPDVPPGLALAVERAVRRDPSERWPGAGAMLTAIVAPDPPRRGRLGARLTAWREGARLEPAPAYGASAAGTPAVGAPRITGAALAAGADLPTVAITRSPELSPPTFLATSVRGSPEPPDGPARDDTSPDEVSPHTASTGAQAATTDAVVASPSAGAAGITEPGVASRAAAMARRLPGRGRRGALAAATATMVALLWALGSRGDAGETHDRPATVDGRGDTRQVVVLELERGGTAAPGGRAVTQTGVENSDADPPISTALNSTATAAAGISADSAFATRHQSGEGVIVGPSPSAPYSPFSRPIPPNAPELQGIPSPTPPAASNDLARPPTTPAPSTARAVAFESRTVAAGGLHSCSVSRAGALFCWGGNERGQLGHAGGRALEAAPLGAVAHVSRVALGLLHSCAITTAEVVVCWGANERGQLGDGSRVARSARDGVPGLADISAVTVGAGHSCALSRVGRALCWGANDDGQLGIGHRVDREVPSYVAGRLRFASIAAGWNHTCALEPDGAALCWGRGGDGQLGDGGTTSRSQPVRVAGNRRFRSIAAGRAHSCGVTRNGAVLCWGENGAGQAGGSDRRDHRTPTAVTGVTDAVKVVAGSMHSCALTSRGQTLCWGQNRYGQLGDGSTTGRGIAAPVGGAPPFVDLAASGAHSCGVTRDGDVYCWGYNLEGQLGDGTRENRSHPVRVRATNPA